MPNRQVELRRQGLGVHDLRIGLVEELLALGRLLMEAVLHLDIGLLCGVGAGAIDPEHDVELFALLELVVERRCDLDGAEGVWIFGLPIRRELGLQDVDLGGRDDAARREFAVK